MNLLDITEAEKFKEMYPKYNSSIFMRNFDYEKFALTTTNPISFEKYKSLFEGFRNLEFISQFDECYKYRYNKIIEILGE